MAGLFSTWVPISPARYLIDDIMYLSRKMPTVIAERRMRLADVIEARNATSPRPSWVAIFLKAFALVAGRHAPLRRIWMPWPWAHFYQHPMSVATFAVERQDGDESVVAIARTSRPATATLAQLDAFVRRSQEKPLRRYSSYRRARRLFWMPGFLRRLLISVGLNLSGKGRARTVGTFALTSPAAHGAGMAQVLSPVTSTLHYGLFDEEGNLDMRLTFDHRVYDGAQAARTLVELEQTLKTTILEELRSMKSVRQAA